ncbi:hypothetical protein ACJJTC_014051 [Scirpophaga incertulas]
MEPGLSLEVNSGNRFISLVSRKSKLGFADSSGVWLGFGVRSTGLRTSFLGLVTLSCGLRDIIWSGKTSFLGLVTLSCGLRDIIWSGKTSFLGLVTLSCGLRNIILSGKASFLGLVTLSYGLRW